MKPIVAPMATALLGRRNMNNNRYELYFYDRTPGAPYIIRENAIINDQLMYQVHSGYTNLQDALEALGRLSEKPILIAFTSETAN